MTDVNGANSTGPAVDAAWEVLVEHQKTIAPLHLRDLFAADPARGEELTVTAADLYIDYSKHRVTRETLGLLLELARASGVEARRDAMFAGAHINTSEDRAVLHTALRMPPDTELMVDGRNVVADVRRVLDRMGEFTDDLRSGRRCGATGRQFETVVNIGIGGSDLGPAMVSRALRHYANGPVARFVSNIDPTDLLSTLSGLDPATTLFVVVSKTFTTLETMANATAARHWIIDALGNDAVTGHFVAVSTNHERTAAFGIDPDAVFGFWDWVGGRYSVGSAVGLSVMAAIGRDRFAEFLAGMYAMDQHFATAPLDANAPVLLGLLGVWYASFFGADSRAVLPYAHDLARFPAYLQQLTMESNGKSVRADGTPVAAATGEVFWGEPGTNGQHAFHQLLHQGTRLIPADFVGFARPLADLPVEGDAATSMHTLLVANMLAQSKVLAFGRTAGEIVAEGVAPELVPHKVMPGNRPSTTILGTQLTPSTLGQLIALYEHQVFVQGVVWGLNSFDQWGVELGKTAALEVAPALAADLGATSVDDRSTAGLVRAFRRAQEAGMPAGQDDGRA
ncbi:glucose-6-phosphate isomerase [Gordonia sp. DT219]|uniref:glucose-6-phosphate isomerase n=1 Tax=Gordonia sp. DT219 TaxID=3416658 RepID=UPI003CF88033